MARVTWLPWLPQAAALARALALLVAADARPRCVVAPPEYEPATTNRHHVLCVRTDAPTKQRNDMTPPLLATYGFPVAVRHIALIASTPLAHLQAMVAVAIVARQTARAHAASTHPQLPPLGVRQRRVLDDRRVHIACVGLPRWTLATRTAGFGVRPVTVAAVVECQVNHCGTVAHGALGHGYLVARATRVTLPHALTVRLALGFGSSGPSPRRTPRAFRSTRGARAAFDVGARLTSTGSLLGPGPFAPTKARSRNTQTLGIPRLA